MTSRVNSRVSSLHLYYLESNYSFDMCYFGLQAEGAEHSIGDGDVSLCNEVSTSHVPNFMKVGFSPRTILK